MSLLGKQIRMNRLIRKESKSCVICALDHGMTSPVFLDGLYDTATRTREAIAGGANVFMMSRGFANRCAGEFTRETSLALMLSASTAGRPAGAVITAIGSVKEALRLGADAVVVYTALAGDNEDWMIAYLSKVGEECEKRGMPLIAGSRMAQCLSDAGQLLDRSGRGLPETQCTPVRGTGSRHRQGELERRRPILRRDRAGM